MTWWGGKPTPGFPLNRRDFLRVAGAGGAALAASELPGCGSVAAETVRHGLSTAERSTLEALAEALIPEDETVGAREAGAVEYIDRLLGTFDHPVPDIYRGGPFSGRTPWPDPDTGDAGRRYPTDEFRRILPPTRLQEAAARIDLLGSAAVEKSNRNAPLVPETPGWLALYRANLAALAQAAAEAGYANLAEASPDERLALFERTEPAFRDALADHLSEGMFCAPEYGGNIGGIAWRDYHYDGDSQPLGHTLFDPATGEPRDRPDRPNQTLDPNLPNDGFEPEIENLVAGITAALGGRRFF